MAEAWPYVLVGVGALATYVWRWLGVALSGRMRAHGRLFDWVGCVAYGLLAALIARMIVLPVGPLAATPLSHRLAGTMLALAAFFVFRGSILAGTAAGAATLVLLALAGAGG